MLKKNIIKATLLLTVLISGACESYLDLKPVNGIVREDFWQTKEQVQSAVIGMYASMLNPDYAEKLFLWGEIRADMIIPGLGAGYDELEVFNGNILPTNELAIWSSFYRTINYCNTVIELAPEVLEVDPTFTEEQLNGFLAEAYALRALNYFYLVRAFKEVPLKLDATISDDVVFNLPKSSEEEILNQIVADLELAETLAVTTYGKRDHDKGRITKYSIYAMQADVYLWKGEYAKCVESCNKIINSGQFGLIAGKDNPLWFQQLYVTGNSNESIFELQFNQQARNPFFGMFSPNVNRSFLVAPNVIDEVFTMDEDDPLNVDIRLAASVRPSNSAIWKYLGLTLEGGGSRSANESYANWIFYRYADVLLMKAEALVLMGEGNGEEAIELINMIRTRANALEGTSRNLNPDNSDAIVEYILDERAREFAYEGKRWFDLLRVARRNNYERLDLLLAAVMENAPADRQQSIVTKYKDVNSHYWPIYQLEIQKNTNLEQNPFYATFQR